MTERRPPDRAEGGAASTWRSRRSAGLPPECGRRGSNSHGPGPPASEAGASTDSATPAGEPSTTAGRLRTPTGRSAQWTQTDSNRHAAPCREAALPLVLWAQRPRGRSRTCRAQCAWVTARCRPTMATRGWDRKIGRDVAECDQIPLLAISSVVKELFGREGLSPFGQITVFTLAGARGVEPHRRRVWRPPGYRRLAPSLVLGCHGPKTKRAASLRKRLLNGQRTFQNAGHAVDGARLGKELEGHCLAEGDVRCDARWPTGRTGPRSTGGSGRSSRRCAA